MFYVAELSTRSIVGDSRGARVWDICEQRAKDRAIALQQNNDTLQFAVVHMADPGNSAFKTLCVEHRNPLKIRM